MQAATHFQILIGILPRSVSTWLAAALFTIVAATVVAAGGRPMGVALLLSFETIIWSVAAIVFGTCSNPRSRQVLLKSWTLRWWIATIVWGGVSTLFISSDPSRSGMTMATLIGPLLLVPAIAHAPSMSYFAVRTTLQWIAAFGLGWLSIGVLFYYWPDNAYYRWMKAQTWQHGVPYSTVDYQGNAGTLITLIGIWVAAAALATPVASNIRPVLWLSLPLVIVAAALNASRTTLLLAPAMMLTTLVIGGSVRPNTSRSRPDSISKFRWSSVLVGTLLLTAVVGAAWLTVGGEHTAATRFRHLYEDLTWPYYPRRLEMTAAAKLVANSPITGWGPGMYATVASQAPVIANQHFALAPPPVGYALQADHHANSDPLELSIDWGIPGMILLLCPALVAVKRGIGGFWEIGNERSERMVSLATVISLIAIGLNGIVDCPLALPALVVIAAIMIGVQLRRKPASVRQSSIRTKNSR